MSGASHCDDRAVVALYCNDAVDRKHAIANFIVFRWVCGEEAFNCSVGVCVYLVLCGHQLQYAHVYLTVDIDTSIILCN